MDTNGLLGLLFLLTGGMDFVLAWFIGGRMSATGRRGLMLFGAVFLVLGFALLLGHLRLV
jgi:hypothetical protein